MQLAVFRALWGMTGTLEEQFDRIAEAGYDGVEGFLAASSLTAAQFSAMVAQRGLKLIMAGGVEKKEDLEPTLKTLAEYQPIKIGLQGGRDCMTRDQGGLFTRKRCASSSRSASRFRMRRIADAHCSRPGTPLFTCAKCRRSSSWRITAIGSTCANGCRTISRHAVDVANAHVFHVHARVGYEEGPQVPDPSAPEYASQLAWHEKQWTAIIRARQQAGDTLMTVTPEYGPPGYLHTLPHTNVPVADLWNVCLWGAQRFRQLFAETV